MNKGPEKSLGDSSSRPKIKSPEQSIPRMVGVSEDVLLKIRAGEVTSWSLPPALPYKTLKPGRFVEFIAAGVPNGVNVKVTAVREEETGRVVIDFEKVKKEEE